ncbi:MAG: protein-L-isoaspartate(D-aspartate) O-methyltransferase [Candidatus Anammoxibacter sp.]
MAIKIIIVVVISVIIVVMYLGMYSKLNADSFKKSKVKEQIINDDDYSYERQSMVKNQIKARGISDIRVLKAMETVPRHKFVPEKFKEYSYRDEPLQIGLGQTISQPYIVAYMTELLGLDKDDKVLEIGTGSGYQAAVLSLLVKEVYTVEIINELGLEAKDRLQKLGYDNVKVRIGDGYNGWMDYATYDAIIVTAAPEHIPPELINQLKPGGKMVIPMGEADIGQILKLITKDHKGQIVTKNVLNVRFVPLTRR